MSNVVIKKNSSENTFLVNNEIEEVLSAGSEDNIRIQKISENMKEGLSSKIQDKIELSSNKDINIGLDLLVNKDKVIKNGSDNGEETPQQLEPIDIGGDDQGNDDNSNVIDLDKQSSEGDTITFNDPTSDLINQLNIDDRTSRLSQDAIDAIIDKNDSREKPNLVDTNDLPQENGSDNPEIDRGVFAPDISSQNQEPSREENMYNDNTQDNYQREPSVDTRREYTPHSNHFGNNYNDYYRHGPPRKTAEQLQKEKKDKEEVLWQLEKYRRLGVQGVKKFNMSSELEDMQAEYSKIKKQRELENSVKFQRKCLVAFATGTELLNSKLDMLDFKLDGWSEQVNENIEEYNEVFEELHEKYKEKAKIAPELKLLFMMGGSAFMYHVTNSMFKNSVPGMEDIMRQNPDLMKQFANAAINQMDGEKQSAAKFFNNFSPGQQPQYEPPSMGGSRPMPDRPAPRPNMQRGPPVEAFSRNIPQQSRPAPVYTEGPPPVRRSSEVNGTVADVVSDSSAFNNGTRKIAAPVGVDDILNELKSNTDEIMSNDNISEVISRSSKKSGTRSINISNRKKPGRSININLGGK